MLIPVRKKFLGGDRERRFLSSSVACTNDDNDDDDDVFEIPFPSENRPLKRRDSFHDYECVLTPLHHDTDLFPLKPSTMALEFISIFCMIPHDDGEDEDSPAKNDGRALDSQPGSNSK
eukprot:jgi/Psemu1/9230/gm1.9230_g